jgi:hypothetical protein
VAVSATGNTAQLNIASSTRLRHIKMKKPFFFSVYFNHYWTVDLVISLQILQGIGKVDVETISGCTNYFVILGGVLAEYVCGWRDQHI